MLEVEYAPVSATVFVHPLEYELQLSAQKDGLFNYFAASVGDLSMKVSSLPQMRLNAFPVNEYTYPRLYRIYRMVLDRLQCDEIFELYVDFDYDLTARSYGSSKDGHLILVNSACMQELNDGELAALLGREVSHIENGHIHYREMLDSIHLITDRLAVAGDIVAKKVSGFFSKWMIASEFSADRAALIASRSFECVATLMLKQMGISPEAEQVRRVLEQHIDLMPEKMGVNYMIMAKAFPTLGMAGRLVELYKWVNTGEFRINYPFMHYMAKAFVPCQLQDETENMLILLHRRANNGNPAAQEQLAVGYHNGTMGLPKAYEPYLALTQAACYNGNGRAMYSMYQILSKNLAGQKASRYLQHQLLRAAASRFGGAQSEAAHLPPLVDFPLLSKAVFASVKKNGSNTTCMLNIQSPGEPLRNETAEEILDAFWMPTSDHIYAAELKRKNGMCYGVALSERGIYGRFIDKRFPYMVSWEDFLRQPLTIYHEGPERYLASGNRKVSRWEGREKMAGTINEILVSLSAEIQKKRGTLHKR